MSVPYFPMFPDDFEADTAHLTLAEDGAYNRLLRLQWRSPGCSMPDDMNWIARKVRATDDTSRAVVEAMLSEYFVCEDGRIFSARLLREYQKAKETFERRSEAGSKGGKARPLKTNDFGPSRAKAGLKQPEPEPEPTVEEAKASLSSDDDEPMPIDEIATAVSAYNAAADQSGWPQVQVLSKSRRTALKARLSECGGLDGWLAALGKAQASDHCCGGNDRGWTVTFDFLTRKSSFTKLMEGNYDNRARNSGPQQRSSGGFRSGTVDAFAEVARRRAQGGA